MTKKRIHQWHSLYLHQSTCTIQYFPNSFTYHLLTKKFIHSAVSLLRSALLRWTSTSLSLTYASISEITLFHQTSNVRRMRRNTQRKLNWKYPIIHARITTNEMNMYKRICWFSRDFCPALFWSYSWLSFDVLITVCLAMFSSLYHHHTCSVTLLCLKSWTYVNKRFMINIKYNLIQCLFISKQRLS